MPNSFVADTVKKMKCTELAEVLNNILTDEKYTSDMQKLKGILAHLLWLYCNYGIVTLI